MQSAAIGFRDHSGWAMVIVLGGAVERPAVLHREHIQLLPASLPRQPYHAVAEQGAPQAVIAEVEAEAAATAAGHVRRIARRLGEAGYELSAAGVAASSTDHRRSLGAVLRSHAMLHAAEGQLYRDAIASALEPLVPHVFRFLARELMGMAATELGLAPEVLRVRLAEMGKAIGPPWAADQKEAAAAAWMALSVI
jgi:hypothetical protein